MSRDNCIPIWLIENSPGGELPSERRYSHSSLGPPLGYVVMPEGMKADRFVDHITLSIGSGVPGNILFDFPNKAHSESGRTVASLGIWRIVEAAVKGEFGLKWENNPNFLRDYSVK